MLLPLSTRVVYTICTVWLETGAVEVTCVVGTSAEVEDWKEVVDTGSIDDVDETSIVVGACDEGVGPDVCCVVVESVPVLVEPAVVEGVAEAEEPSDDAFVVEEVAVELADAPVPIGIDCRCMMSRSNSAADTKESTASSAAKAITTLYNRPILRKIEQWSAVIYVW